MRDARQTDRRLGLKLATRCLTQHQEGGATRKSTIASPDGNRCSQANRPLGRALLDPV